MALALMAGVRVRREGEHWEEAYWTSSEVPSKVTYVLHSRLHDTKTYLHMTRMDSTVFAQPVSVKTCPTWPCSYSSAVRPHIIAQSGSRPQTPEHLPAYSIF